MAEVKMPEVNTEEILGTKKTDTLKKNTQLSAKPEKKKQTFLSRAMMGLKSKPRIPHSLSTVVRSGTVPFVSHLETAW